MSLNAQFYCPQQCTMLFVVPYSIPYAFILNQFLFRVFDFFT